jgi:hypothetical protein
MCFVKKGKKGMHRLLVKLIIKEAVFRVNIGYAAVFSFFH